MTPIAHRSWRHSAISVVAVSALLTTGVIGFGPVFAGVDYLRAGLGGIGVGMVVAVIGARWRLGAVSIAGIVVVAYLLIGPALAVPSTTLAGFIPTVASWQTLLLGAVQSWKQLLTVLVPVENLEILLVVPLMSGLLSAVVAGSVALRTSRAAWALLPASMVMVTAIAFGSERVAFPLVQGFAFAIVALTWLAWRRAAARRSTTRYSHEQIDIASARRLQLRRIASGVALLIVAATVAAGMFAVVEPVAPRQVLRTAVLPPLDIEQYPSPLQSFRKYVKQGITSSSPLFEVTGLPQGHRVRLATLDHYDGTVYAVSADGGTGAGSFTPLTGAKTPKSQVNPDSEAASTVDIMIAIEKLTGIWMPGVGDARTITFTGDRQSALASGLHFNPTTGVAITTANMRQGDSYQITATLPRLLSAEDAAQSEAAVTKLEVPPNQNVPDSVSEFAARATATSTSASAQLNDLATALIDEGYFSHGVGSDAPSLPGHSAQRIDAFLSANQLVGDDEQYAVALALMANQLGIPARVVMGFYPDQWSPGGSLPITGDNVHAWVEVLFDGLGWVTVDSTPSQDKKPEQEITEPQAAPQAQVPQPPPPPLPPVTAPLDENKRGADPEEVAEPSDGIIGAFLQVGGLSLGAILLALSPAVLIGLLKARRRKSRRQAGATPDRMSGGWDEIVDTAVDLGSALPVGITRGEGAKLLAARYPHSSVLDLATTADISVFGPGDPSAQDAHRFWADVERVRIDMLTAAGRAGRIRSRLSIRSFALRRRLSATTRSGSRRRRK